MAQTPEKKIENKIRKNFENAGGYIKKFFASPHTNKGIPDLIGVINEKYVALEVKRPIGGKPTPVQLKNLQEIANAGGIACVTNDPDIVNIIVNQNSNRTQKLTSESGNLDYAKIPTSGINEIDAKNLWQTKKEPHTLQIIGQDVKL